MTELTEMVLDYQRTGEGYEKLRRRVEQWVYFFPADRPGFAQEDCADFLLHARPRIPVMLRRYEHSDRSFEHYLAKTLRWQLRSFARVRRRRSRMFEISRAPDLWDGLVGVAEGEEPFAASDGVAGAGAQIRIVPRHRPRRPRRGAAKRIMILALKAAPVISDAQLAEVARLTGYSPDWLKECRGRLRADVARRESRRVELRLRRNDAFFRVRMAQDELFTTTEPDRRERLAREIERQNHRLRKAREELSRVPAVPTNAELARIVGLPKGTIDSALHQLKRTLACTRVTPDNATGPVARPLAKVRRIR